MKEYQNPEMLRSLYWEDSLSTRQIAKRCDTYHTTVLDWMKKFKIPRRPCLTNKLADVSEKFLQDLYLKEGLNTTEIAKRFNVTHSPILEKLKKLNTPIRSKSERQIKFPKTPFSRYLVEKAYMLGLRTGDIHARAHPGNSKLIRIQSATTHPAFIRMVNSAFGEYSAVRTHFQKKRKEWVVYSDLDESFEFLIRKPKKLPKWILENTNCFISFLAGYMDAEGNWIITKSNENDVRYMFRIRTCDKRILQEIKNKLEKLGLKCYFYLDRKKGSSTTFGKINRDFYGIRVYRTIDIIKIIKMLLPFSRHDEKILRMKFILENKGKKWDEIKDSLHELQTRIKNEVIK